MVTVTATTIAAVTDAVDHLLSSSYLARNILEFDDDDDDDGQTWMHNIYPICHDGQMYALRQMGVHCTMFRAVIIASN